jgi:hypothetical protein
LWDRLQAKLARNRSAAGAPPIRSEYTGVMECGQCGGILYRHKTDFACMSAKLLPGEPKDGAHGCGRNRIRSAVAEAWIDAEVVRRLRAGDHGATLPSVNVTELQATVAGHVDTLALYEDWRAAGEMDAREYHRLAQAEKKHLAKAKLALQTAQAENLGLAVSANGLLDLDYVDMDRGNRRKLIEAAFVECIVVAAGAVDDAERMTLPLGNQDRQAKKVVA